MENEVDLTEVEQLFYGNYGYTQQCCLCGKDVAIHKYDMYNERDNEIYIEYNGKQFLCNKCRG